jgi:hypothetical protein
MTDRSFKTEKEVSQRFALPFVFSVPLMPTQAEERMRNWTRAFEWLAGSVLALVVVVAEFYVYRHH